MYYLVGKKFKDPNPVEQRLFKKKENNSYSDLYFHVD